MITQIQTLNYLLSRGDSSLLTTRGLSLDHFPQLRNEFKFILNHFNKYNQLPDMSTFLKTFPDFEVIEVNESIDYLISELNKEKTETNIIELVNKIKEPLLKGETDKVTQMISSFSDKLTSSKHLEAVDILNDISRYDSYIDKCNDFNKYYISTGFRELDEIIGGWDRNEEYATIAARSGTGKTWILLKSITASVERGLRVGLFSGEMSVNKVAYRFDTLMGHISNGKLTHGNIEAAVGYKRYLDNLKDNHKGSLYVLTPNMVDGLCGVNALRGFVEKYNLDILFIDQHSLLQDDRHGRTTFESAANISGDLKQLQVRKGIPIITVSQQNRSSIDEGKFAGTENISNSDKISQDSTVILFLSTKDDIMTIHIAKSRDGGSFKQIKYAVDFDKGNFTYIPEEKDLEDEDSLNEANELLNKYSPTNNNEERNDIFK